MKSLAGLLVVDFTRVLSGPYCTMVLGDLGARVIKIEQPTGDDSRTFPPMVGETSAYFASVNRGKESICLDLREPAGLELAKAIVAKADILVENFRPGVMERLGLGYDTLRATNTELIYASISGFGQDGPYRDRPAYDMVVQAMGGIMSITGHPDSPPTRVGTSVGDIVAGIYAAVGISSALVERSNSGAGQYIDVSMLDCQTAILESAIGRYFASGESPEPMGSRHPSINPFAAYKAHDGYLVIAAGNDGLYAKLAEILMVPSIATEARFATNALRTENHLALSEAIEAALEPHSVAHWLDVLGEAGIPCGPINNIQQALEDPQTVSRDMVITASDSAGAEMKMAGSPLTKVHSAYVPSLDEHGTRLREEFGASSPALEDQAR